MKNLSQYIFERKENLIQEVEFDPEKFYLGEVFYQIEKDDIRIENDNEDTGDTESEDKDGIMKLIQHWTKYPEGSYYYDCKFANDEIPVFYIFNGDEEDEENRIILDETFYISKEDEKYKDKIQKAIMKKFLPEVDFIFEPAQEEKEKPEAKIELI